MTDPIVLTDANAMAIAGDFATAHFKEPQPWWRGHGDQSWALRPGVFRELPGGRSYNEPYLVHRFRAFAPARREKCPGDDDAAGWLMLMQHYGLPTRLLDWTEGLAIAMYFAVCDPKLDGKEGAVWALAPGGFNAALATTPTPGLPKPICLSGTPEVKAIALRAFNAVGTTPMPDAVAFLPDHIDPRMMVQHGRCTASDNATPLENKPGADKYLLKMLVPADKKRPWRRFLSLIGIEQSTLFPDLGSLADAIKRGDL